MNLFEGIWLCWFVCVVGFCGFLLYDCATCDEFVVGALQLVTFVSDDRVDLVIDGCVYSVTVPKVVDVLGEGVFQERFMSVDELGVLVGQRVLLEYVRVWRFADFSGRSGFGVSIVSVGGVK